MNFQFSNKIKIFVSSLAAAVVLLLAVFLGVSSGKQIAQAQFLAVTSQNAVSALQYFYRDQNRYPSATEFADQNLMLNYMNNFPLPDLPSAKCGQSFVYKRPDPQTFSLGFCLPTAVGNYQAGWNVINGSPAATSK